MVFRLHADDEPRLNAGLIGSFVLFQGIWTSINIAKKTLYFCDFSGGGGGSGPLDPRIHISGR